MPSRKSILVSLLLLVLIGVPVGAFLWYRHMIEVVADCYIQEHLAATLIEHMERHRGEWPRSWEELRKAEEICRARGGSFSLNELRTHCSVDFTADPAELQKAPSNGRDPPIHVVGLNNGKKHHWSGGEPNQLIYEYLQRRAGDPQLTYLDRPVDAERSARHALLELGAQWTLDDKGHVVTVHMGSLKGSPRFSDAELKHVTGFTELRELILDHSNISDDGLKQIEGLSKLNVLQLNGTQISDAGLKHLSGMRQLHTLSLAFCRLTDAALPLLVQLPALKMLNLNDTEVSDAGVDQLSKVGSLEEIMLYDTKVTPAGAARLRTALPTVRIGGPE